MPEQRGERGGWPWELRAWSRHCGMPMCGSLGAGWGRCLAPALWTGMLGATEVAGGCLESWGTKPPPALSNAAQKCFFLVI